MDTPSGHEISDFSTYYTCKQTGFTQFSLAKSGRHECRITACPYRDLYKNARLVIRNDSVEHQPFPADQGPASGRSPVLAPEDLQLWKARQPVMDDLCRGLHPSPVFKLRLEGLSWPIPLTTCSYRTRRTITARRTITQQLLFFTGSPDQKVILWHPFVSPTRG